MLYSGVRSPLVRFTVCNPALSTSTVSPVDGNVSMVAVLPVNTVPNVVLTASAVYDVTKRVDVVADLKYVIGHSDAAEANSIPVGKFTKEYACVPMLVTSPVKMSAATSRLVGSKPYTMVVPAAIARLSTRESTRFDTFSVAMSTLTILELP